VTTRLTVRREELAALVAFLWPFVFMAERVVPLGGRIRGTTNDFAYLYYVYKAYLLDHLARGTLPLWSPAEAAGFPFAANPFTQAFYPLNLALAAFYAAAGGYSLHDHQVFTVFGMSLFALGLFRWLRSRGQGVGAALFATCLVSTSFRMGDLMRFPNAVHTALWYPWILLSFDRILAGRLRWAPALFLFLVCLLTAGYLYYVYYGFFLFAGYLAMAAVPRLRRAGFVPDAGPRAPARLALIAGVGLLAGLACLPYLWQVKRLLDATYGRVEVDPGIAALYAFHARDTLNSLLYPVGASPEGCYYFGIAGVLILALSFSWLYLERGPVPPHDRLLCATLLAVFLLLSDVSYETDSWLFLALRQVVPGFARLRVWGRLGIVLLLVLAWLLARAFDHLEARRLDPTRRRAGALVLIASALGVFAVQVLQLRAGYVHSYYHDYLPDLARYASWHLTGAVVSVLAVGLLLLTGISRPLLVAMLLAVSAFDVWPTASRLWGVLIPTPRRERLDVPSVLARSLATPRQPGREEVTTISMYWDQATRPVVFMRLSPSFNVGLLRQWYFERYVSFLERAQADPGARDTLLGLRDGRRLFVTARGDHGRLREFLEDDARLAARVRVLAYTGDELAAEVDAPRAAFLTFVDNWDPYWTASVDGRAQALYPAFGTFKAVAVPAGTHRVEFRYAPFGEALRAQTSTESRVSR
jgi:hypothetical protein